MGYTRWYVTKTPWLHWSFTLHSIFTNMFPTKIAQISRRFALVNLGQIELASMINCVSSRTSVSSNGVAWISECWFLVGQTESTLLISPCFTKKIPISILPLDSCWLLVCNENPHCRNNHMWPAIESFPLDLNLQQGGWEPSSRLGKTEDEFRVRHVWVPCQTSRVQPNNRDYTRRNREFTRILPLKVFPYKSPVS